MKDRIQCVLFRIGYLQLNNPVNYQYAAKQGKNVIVKGMMVIQLGLWS